MKRKGMVPSEVLLRTFENYAVEHSVQLTTVFEEAEQIFSERRQRLNNLALKVLRRGETTIPDCSMWLNDLEARLENLFIPYL
jgi:hypothetical protein